MNGTLGPSSEAVKDFVKRLQNADNGSSILG